MPTHANGRRAGVTLFEAVAAMAIVGLVSIAALEAAGAEMRAADHARRTVEASALAQQRLDWLDFLNETQLRALPDTVKEGKFPDPLAEYSWTTESTPIPSQAGVYDVVVKIIWNKDESFKLESMIYRRPVISTGNGRGGATRRGG